MKARLSKQLILPLTTAVSIALQLASSLLPTHHRDFADFEPREGSLLPEIPAKVPHFHKCPAVAGTSVAAEKRSNQMPVRRIITRSGRHFRGLYPSRKIGRMVAFESILERDVIMLLEFSGAVSSFEEQPIRITYSDGDRMRDYYPDFRADLVTGECLHLEAKPAAKLMLPKVATQLAAVTTHYAQHRPETFRIITETVANAEPLHTNLARLSALRAQPWALPKPARLPAQGETRETLKVAIGLDALLRNLAIGNFVCDLRLPLGGDLPVHTTSGGHHDALYL